MEQASYDPNADDWAQTYRDLGYEYDFVCREWHRPGYVCVRCHCDDSPHVPPRCDIEGEVITNARELEK